MAKYNGAELFPIVDEKGDVIGSASRKECHSGTKKLHPVVHLHVFDSEGRLFLQKRSENKDIQPGKWDTSVGGHIDYGETVGEALQRETFEELGFYANSLELLYKYVFESDVERELVHTFRCVVEHSDIKFAPDEIEDGRFFRFEEIESLIAKSQTTPNFVMEFNMLKQQAFLKTKE